ncbi:MAG: lysylphosphatidylglycerol synthase transmembrane domain-containing protein [Anaerolineae bacterium]
MEGVERADRKSHLRGRTLRWVLSVLGILVFGAIVYYGGVEALTVVSRANVLYLLYAFVFSASADVLTSLRWGGIVNALEEKVVQSRLSYLYYVMLGKMSSMLVSQYVGDYGARPLALKASSGTALGKGFYSVLLDRFFDLVLSLLFVGPAVLCFLNLIPPDSVVPVSVVVAAVYWAASAKNYRLLTGCLGGIVYVIGRKKVWRPVPANLTARLVETLLAAKQGLEDIGPRGILRANLLTFGRYVAMALRAYFISVALNLAMPFWVVFVGLGIVRFTLLFAVAPGRLGAMEVGWYGLLALAGLESSIVIPFLIGLRVYGFLFNAVLSLGTHLAVMVVPHKAV